MRKNHYIVTLLAVLLVSWAVRAQDTCTAIVVTGTSPWSEGFESGTMSACWSQSGNHSWSVATGDYSTSTGAHTGTYNLKITPNSYSGTTTLITPVLDLSTLTGDVMLSFWHIQRAWYSDIDELKVSYRTSSTGSWVTLATYTAAYETWTEESFLLPSPSATYQLAFECTAHYGYGIGIDDILVREDNGCNKPSMAVVDTVGPYTADLRWTSSTLASAYDLFYGTSNNIANAIVVDNLSDTAYQLTNLLPQTTYYAWVRTACGSDSADVKPFGSFTTQLTCAPIMGATVAEVSYTAVAISWAYDTTQGFPSQGAIITLTDLTDTTVTPLEITVSDQTTYYIFTGLDAGHNYHATLRNLCLTDYQTDTAAVVALNFVTASCAEISGGNATSIYNPFYHYYDYSYTQNLYLASQMSPVDTIHGIRLHALSSGSVPSLNIYMGHTSLGALGTSSYVPATDLQLVATIPTFSFTTGWNTITFDTAFVYNGTSNLVLAVDNNSGAWASSSYSWSCHTTPGAQSVYWYQDGTDITITAPSANSSSAVNNVLDIQFVAACQVPSCTPVMLMAVDDVTPSSVTIHWVNVGAAAQFILESKGPADTQFVSVATISDTHYTFTGLTASSDYMFRVGVLCDGDTLWKIISATTLCAPIAINEELPYFEDFDSYPLNEMPPCWDYNTTYVTHYDGGLFWRSNGGNAIAVLPPIDAPLSYLELTFKAKMGTPAENDRWVIGAADDQGNLLEWIDTSLIVAGQSRSSFTEFTFRLNDYQGNGTRIAITHTYTGSDWSLLDSLTVRYIPNCLPVANLIGHNLISADSIWFSWNSPGGSTSFQVVYDTITAVIDSIESSAVTVNDSSYLIPTALVRGAKYSLWVRAICPPSQYSTWTQLTFAAGEVIMPTSGSDTIQGCGFVVYDNGGPFGGYVASSTTTLIVRPENQGDAVIVKAGSWIYPFINGYSNFYIYDGEGTNGTLLYSTTDPDTLTSDIVGEAGPITIHFVAGQWVNHGYEIFLGCQAAPTCPRPQNVAAVSNDSTTATVSWSHAGATAYHLYYRMQGTVNWTMATVTASPALLTGLTPGTTYEYYLRAICSATDSSAATSNGAFTTVGGTTSSCAQPVITATTPADNSITMTFNGDADAYQVSIVQGLWNGTPGSVQSTYNNSYTFTGLTAGTRYTVAVRAQCYDYDLDDYVYSSWATSVVTTTGENPNPQPDTVYYTVSVTYNAEMGTVIGAGTYPENTTVTLEAHANEGYHFLIWSDEVTDSVRTFVLTSDIALTAAFARNVGIDAVDGSTVTLYPNPAATTVTISGVDGQANVSVIDLNGCEVLRTTATTIDISALAKGAYFVRVVTAKGTAVRKLIVK